MTIPNQPSDDARREYLAKVFELDPEDDGELTAILELRRNFHAPYRSNDAVVPRENIAAKQQLIDQLANEIWQLPEAEIVDQLSSLEETSELGILDQARWFRRLLEVRPEMTALENSKKVYSQLCRQFALGLTDRRCQHLPPGDVTQWPANWQKFRTVAKRLAPNLWQLAVPWDVPPHPKAARKPIFDFSWGNSVDPWYKNRAFWWILIIIISRVSAIIMKKSHE